MRLLFVVGHPAHVHFFRNAIKELQDRGHIVRVAAVDKETTLQLLEIYGLDYTVIGRSSRNMVSKAMSLPVKDIRLMRLLARARPDIVVSTGSPYAAHASAVMSLPHIAFCDTEIATAVMRLMVPFTDAICTPSCFQRTLGSRQVRYNGYKELAYLHPSRFRPDPHILELLHCRAGEKLIVVRFSSLDSSHDRDERGIRGNLHLGGYSRLSELESLGRVIITSEGTLPPVLKKFSPEIPVERMHDLLYFATLYVGEGATMASEAGILGTPWIFVSRSRRGFLDDQAAGYGLGFQEVSWERALIRSRELLAKDDLKPIWAARRARLLADKVDVSDFMIDFIEKWPKSHSGITRFPGATSVASQEDREKDGAECGLR